MEPKEDLPCSNAVSVDDTVRHHHNPENSTVSNNLSHTTPEDDPSLLCLPNELLAHITRSVDGKERAKTLCNLSLVNRRLGSISRDELYSTPAVTLDTIRQLLSRLFEEPKLAKGIVELEIMDDDHQDSKEAPKFPSASLTKLREALLLDETSDDTLKVIKAPFSYLAATLAVTPNLKQLTFSFRAARSLLLYQDKLDEIHRQSPQTRPLRILGYTSGKLRDITILPNVPDLPRHMYKLTLYWLRNQQLDKVRTVAGLAVGLQTNRYKTAAIEYMGFPPSLQCLLLDDCTIPVLPILEEIFETKLRLYPYLGDVPGQWCLETQRQREEVAGNTRIIFGGMDKRFELPKLEKEC